MFKWLTRRAPRQTGPLRCILLPMPERLLDITVAAKRVSPLPRRWSNEFSAIITSLWINDVNKRTAPGRLPDTLSAVAAALPRNLPALRLVDLGASDAVSTWDAVCFLRQRLRIPIAATAVDLYTQLQRFDGRLVTEYRTSDGSPVLLRCGRFALRLGRRLAFPPAEFVRTRFLGSHRIRGRLRHSLDIPLIHPLAAADPDIEVIEADARRRRPEWSAAFHLVRISNLLNHGYFTRSEMGAIVGHAVEYLQIGGLLVVSRNAGDAGTDVERGSIWRRESAGLQWVSDFNGGSELRAWMEQFESPATRAAA